MLLRRSFLGLYAVACLLLVSACGSTTSDEEEVSALPFAEDAEFFAQYGLNQVSAQTFLSMETFGKGIAVAVIDTGLTQSHSEFSGRVHSASKDIINDNADTSDTDHGHGTAVSGVIAANRDGVGMHGIAPEAKIMALETDVGGFFSEVDLATAIDYAVANGAQVINMSLGGAGSVGATLQTAMQNAATAGVAIVMATGNDGNAVASSAPANEAGKAVYDGHLLAVGSVDNTGTISSFSNLCPAGAETYCLTAPGEDIVMPSGSGAGYVTSNGTSFSTPHVAGAIALLMGRYPTLTAKQVIQILLDSADDPTPNPTDTLYGNGRLDLSGAVQPLGVLVIAPGGGGVGGGNAVAGSTLSAGAALGNGLRDNIIVANIVATDAYDRAYAVDMTQAISSKRFQANVAGFLSLASAENTQIPIDALRGIVQFTQSADEFDRSAEPGEITSFAFSGSPSPDRNYVMGYSSGTIRNGALGSRDWTRASMPLAGSQSGAFEKLVAAPVYGSIANTNGKWTTSFGAQFGANAYNLNGGASVALSRNLSVGARLDLTYEADGFLGTSGTGAFDGGYQATTLSGEIAVAYEKGPWAFFASYTAGQSRVTDDRSALLTSIRGLRAEAAQIGLTRQNVFRTGDRLALLISRALRVTSGTAWVNANYATGGASVQSQSAQSLEPTGHETHFELAYSTSPSPLSTLQIGALLTIQPGHDASAAPDLTAAIKYERRF